MQERHKLLHKNDKNVENVCLMLKIPPKVPPLPLNVAEFAHQWEQEEAESNSSAWDTFSR